MVEFTLYYVLNGLVDGQRGCPAVVAGDDQLPSQADGHYFLVDGESDGRGPYECREDAAEAGNSWAMDEQYWLFKLGYPPHLMGVDEDYSDGEMAKITRLEQGRFECGIEGSYEELRLFVTCKDHETAANIFGALITAYAEFS